MIENFILEMYFYYAANNLNSVRWNLNMRYFFLSVYLYNIKFWDLFYMWISCPSQLNMNLENSMFYIHVARAKSYKNDPEITICQISAKCIIPYKNDLEYHGQGHQ